jgi:hypothetical protein
VNANLTNQAIGEVRVAENESLVVSGSAHTNAGKVEITGGSLEFIGPVTNSINTGLITGRSATLRFQSGLTNNGSLLLSSGVNDVSGDVANSASGKVVVAGGAHATFHDDVTQNGSLQVIKVGSTTSVAVFAGTFDGAGGSSGGGDIFFLSDLRPGNSTATVNFANNVGFGSQAALAIELGGVVPGTRYDQVHVTGAPGSIADQWLRARGWQLVRHPRLDQSQRHVCQCSTANTHERPRLGFLTALYVRHSLRRV